MSRRDVGGGGSGSDPGGNGGGGGGGEMRWPTATLDRIARLRVLAAGLPGTAVRETVFDAPFDRVWTALTDFERSVPAFDGDVGRLRVVSRRGDPARRESLKVVSYQTARVLWIPARLDLDVAPGWCWMVSRPQLYVIGMAAEPDGERTRLAHLEGVAVPGPGPIQTLLRPVLAVSRWRHRRHLPHDLAGMHRFLHAEMETERDL